MTSTLTGTSNGAVALADGTTKVGLQASFSYGTAPNLKTITLTTEDIANLSKGIQFTLQEPVTLGTLTDFLTWASAKLSFPAVDPTSWPAPFDGMALFVVTIQQLAIDQQATPPSYLLEVTMTADPAHAAKIPIIDVDITGFGLTISKGVVTPALLAETPVAELLPAV